MLGVELIQKSLLPMPFCVSVGVVDEAVRMPLRTDVCANGRHLRAHADAAAEAEQHAKSHRKWLLWEFPNPLLRGHRASAARAMRCATALVRKSPYRTSVVPTILAHAPRGPAPTQLHSTRAAGGR